MAWLKIVKLLPQLSGVVASLQVKGWYLSKTVWLNLLVLISSVAYALTGNDAFTLTGDESAALSLAGVATANIVLRILTSKPIGLRSVPGPAESGHDEDESYRDDIGI